MLVWTAVKKSLGKFSGPGWFHLTGSKSSVFIIDQLVAISRPDVRSDIRIQLCLR